MKNNTISICNKDYIDVIILNQIVATSYNKQSKTFDIYLKDYTLSYYITSFNDEKDFINTINKVNRAIKGYREEKYVQEVC